MWPPTFPGTAAQPPRLPRTRISGSKWLAPSPLNRTLVNLNNGGGEPVARMGAEDAMGRHLAYSNLAPTYTMWQVLEPQREGGEVTGRAPMGGSMRCEEVAFTRNASESLQTMQLGMDLKPGERGPDHYPGTMAA